MKNREIARIFSDIADIMEIKEENTFKIRAYRKAALNLEGLTRDLAEMSRKDLLEIPGIGADLAGKIEEYLQTGVIAMHEKLKGEIPAGVFALLAVPDLGPKTAKNIYDTLGVASMDELEQAAAEHRLVGVRGIQQKTEENILKGIAAVKRGRERKPLGRILPAAMDLVAALKKIAPVERIEVAGSIRRRRESIKDIDIVATSPDPPAVMEAFVNIPQVYEVIMRGPTRASVQIRDGVQVDLRVVEPESFGAALAYLTGSKAHNVRLREMAVKQGLKINEYGIFSEQGNKRLGGDNEEDVYRLVGLPFIPPELREDQGEIEAALAGKLPQLITLADLRGDLHVHSKWSDGAHSIADVAEAARRSGLSYLAITDHSQGLGIARGLTVERLMEQAGEIRALNLELKGFRVLHGTEMDIQADGALDFPDDVLKKLDVVVASIHSGFGFPRDRMTARIAAAMRNPYVSIIAHPTGRLIGEREGYDVDMEALLQVARETGTAMEINSYPLRLDLADKYVRRAKELGVAIAISSDAHVKTQFDTLAYGISVAQRGWLEKGDVLNAMEAPELLKRLAEKRKGAGGPVAAVQEKPKSTRRYWLFKTEPGTFSIEDLKSKPDATEHWDGVRNPQARDFLRDQVQVGDLVFFYHSSIPEPAIVGVAEVVKSGYPDWTAFDPESRYYDPRSSQEKPRWYMVDVKFVRELPRPVTLAELRGIPELSSMVLLKRSRLSIQPVTEEEWTVVMRMAGISEVAGRGGQVEEPRKSQERKG